MQISALILLASSSVALSLAVYPRFRTDKAQTQRPHAGKSLMQMPTEELSNLFYSSIKYWDIDEFPHVPESEKADMKRGIMKQLVNISDESIKCNCPRLLGPLVCDKTGNLHSSICRYHCKIASENETAELITPIMILTETAFPQSKKKCQTYFTQEKSDVASSRS